MNKMRGQSILEYILVLTAIVAGIAMGSTRIRNAINSAMGDASTTVTNATRRIRSL